MGQNYFFGCISFNLKVIWPNLVRSEILDLGTLDLETAVPPQQCRHVDGHRQRNGGPIGRNPIILFETDSKGTSLHAKSISSLGDWSDEHEASGGKGKADADPPHQASG